MLLREGAADRCAGAGVDQLRGEDQLRGALFLTVTPSRPPVANMAIHRFQPDHTMSPSLPRARPPHRGRRHRGHDHRGRPRRDASGEPITPAGIPDRPFFVEGAERETPSPLRSTGFSPTALLAGADSPGTQRGRAGVRDRVAPVGPPMSEWEIDGNKATATLLRRNEAGATDLTLAPCSAASESRRRAARRSPPRPRGGTAEHGLPRLRRGVTVYFPVLVRAPPARGRWSRPQAMARLSDRDRDLVRGPVHGPVLKGSGSVRRGRRTPTTS